MPESVIIVIAAYILDLIFGDPLWLPHPIKGIGWLIKKLEISLNKLIKNKRLGGIFLAMLASGITWGAAYGITKEVFALNRYTGIGLSVFLIYSSLSIKDLKIESFRVLNALKKSDLPLARRNLSLIVGRDTGELGRSEIIRAAVETISESTVDGIISPLFYAVIGGAPLALAYKAISTLDSMVGYKNEKYKDFGWASAKLDDLANFIPARLSGFFIPIASLFAGKNILRSWKVLRRDGRKNPSPNSGIPQAAIAGALGIQLGGKNFYNSVPALKPLIGDNCLSLSLEHIQESVKVSYICSVLFLIAGIFLSILTGGR